MHDSSSGQLTIWMRAGEPEVPAECLWTGDSCGAIATGPDAAIYHQVTENFEACFGSTVVRGEYVQRYSGCEEKLPGALHTQLHMKLKRS